MVRQRRAAELFDHGDSDSPGSTHPASLLARHAAAPYNTASNSGSDSRNSFLLPNTLILPNGFRPQASTPGGTADVR